MPLTTNQRYWVRSEIGLDPPPEDYELDAAYDRLGSKAAVAAEVIRQRRADLLSGPLSFAVEGYSQNAAGNIQALDAQLKSLDAQAEEELGVLPLGVRIVQLERDAPRR